MKGWDENRSSIDWIFDWRSDVSCEIYFRPNCRFESEMMFERGKVRSVKISNFVPQEEGRSCVFGTTWEWVNDNRFIGFFYEKEASIFFFLLWRFMESWRKNSCFSCTLHITAVKSRRAQSTEVAFWWLNRLAWIILSIYSYRTQEPSCKRVKTNVRTRLKGRPIIKVRANSQLDCVHLWSSLLSCN